MRIRTSPILALTSVLLVACSGGSAGEGASVPAAGPQPPGPDGPLPPGPVGGLAVTPAEAFVTGGPKGGPFAPAAKTYTVKNASAVTRTWVAWTDAPWLQLSATSGTLAGGAEAQLVASVVPGVAGGLAGAQAHAGRLLVGDLTFSEVLLDTDVELHVGTTIAEKSWVKVHGQDFFPIYVWQQPPDSYWVGYHKSLGINTYMDHGYTPNDQYNEQLLALLDANDMHAVLEFDANPNVVGHPRLLAWLTDDDEPFHTGVSVADVQADYDSIKAADPDHLVTINFGSKFYWDWQFGDPGNEPAFQQYTDIPELISFDFYPVTGWNQPTWVYMNGAMSAFMRDVYVDHAKPVWAIVEASDQRLSWTPPSTTGPSPEQMRLEVWDSIINGATAIGYFTIAFNPFEWANLTPAIEAEMQRTNGQIQALSSVILSPPSTLPLSTVEVSGQDHDVTVREEGSSYWIFAANTDMGYQPATIDFHFNQPPSSVAVYDEGRTITPTGNSFTDAFQPLEVHVYEVKF